MSDQHAVTPSPVHSHHTLSDGYGVSLSVYTWEAPQPHGIVQIAHGIGEHALRYAPFAEQLQRAGFTVIAHDHRGHGQTGMAQWNNDRSRLGKLGPGGLRAAEAAICTVTDYARTTHPTLPVIMFGHSWGSLMVQRILNRDPDLYDAVVLSGSAHRTPWHMESGDLNRAWKTPTANGFEWLSRDEKIQQAFIQDPLCFSANVLKLFGLADGLRLYGVPQHVAPQVPLLIVSGSADPLSTRNGLRVLANAYRKCGVTDVSLRLYPGARHELLNETNRDVVMADLVSWLQERFPPNEEQA